jgi:hypothetical protein
MTWFKARELKWKEQRDGWQLQNYSEKFTLILLLSKW